MTTRPTAPHPRLTLESPRPLSPRRMLALPSPSSPPCAQKSPSRAPCPRGRPPPAITAVVVCSPRSSLPHPSSRPNDPVASFLGLHRFSPTRLPPSRAAGPPPPRSRPPLSAPSPWSHHCRPPSRAPRPSRGSPRSPLAFPQWGPHRRSLSSPGKATPFFLCSSPDQGPALRRNRSSGV